VNTLSRWIWTAGCLLAAAVWSTPPAVAESSLELPLPEEYGAIAAGTFDSEGLRLGDAELSAEVGDNGNTTIRASYGIEGSASTRYSVELEPVKEGTALRPLVQTSQSKNEMGESLGRMIIDHRAGFAYCKPPASAKKQEIKEVRLPTRDLISNVPLNLLFQPLVRGEIEEIEFQIFLCRPTPRLIEAKGKVVKSKLNGIGVVEVQYTIDLGGMWNRIAAPFVPKLSVWFDPTVPNAWIGHRAPLYTQGPTVSIVRGGVAPSRIGARSE